MIKIDVIVSDISLFQKIIRNHIENKIVIINKIVCFYFF